MKQKSLLSMLIICMLMAALFAAMLLIKKFTGYASLTAEAGTITSLIITHKQATIYWTGNYGLALMETEFNDTQTGAAYPGTVSEKHLIFNCLQPNTEHEVYAAIVSLDTLDWSSARAGTAQMVDSYIGINSSPIDSATNTFNFTENYTVSGTTIANVPTAHTYVSGSANSTMFSVGILNVSGQAVFAAKITSSITKNYKGGSSNYQMLLAVPNTTVTYYFSTDPGDICPAGMRSGVIGDGYISGYVTSNLTGMPLANVTISVSSAVNTTNANGFFNITVTSGFHQLVGTKEGYQAHIGTANVSLLETAWHNFSITEFRGLSEGNGTVKGIVRDNSTNATLQGVMVYVAGRTANTDQNGNYSINATMGMQLLVASRNSYQNYLANVTINYSNTTVHNIYLALLTGTLEGVVTRTDTGALVEDATISAAGQSTATNSTGRFMLEIAPGAHTVSATKSGYESDAGVVNVTAGRKSYINFSITPKTGTLAGTVYDNVTNNTLSNAKVYLANTLITTTGSGNFSITTTAGTHVLWIFREGYETFVENVTLVGLITTNKSVMMRPTNGTLAGNATDSETSQRISNVTVNINGLSALTNANGSYNVTALTGRHVFVAIKQGYESFAGNATIEPGKTTYANIQLTSSNKTLAAGSGYISGKVTTQAGAALENVSVAIAGQVNITNSTGNYLINVTAGTHNIVAARTGYTPYYAQVTVNASNTTRHDFNMSLAVTQGLGTGQGAGSGAGLGAGKGAGTGLTSKKTTQAPIIKQEEGLKKVLDVSRIMRRLRQGTFVTVPVQATNYRASPVLLTFQITGEVSSMATLDKTAMVLSPNEKADATLTLMAIAEPGVYNGTLTMTGDIEESVPIDLLIIPKEKLSIEVLQLKLELFDKRVNPGGQLKYKIDIQNLLTDEEYTVRLSYAAKHQDNNLTYWIGNDEVTLKTSQTLLREYQLPKDMPAGDYLLSVDAEYISFSSSHTEPFTVVLPLYRYSFFGILPLWAVAIAVLGLSTSAFGAISYQKHKAKGKRYQIQVDYKSIPKAGLRSALAGKIAETANNAYFDLDLFQIHTLIAGASGSGKTVTAEVLVEEALQHGAAVIVFDPTAQWTGFLRKNTDKKMLALYPQFGMKPTDARSFSGNVRQINSKNEAIEIKKFIKPGEITIFSINKLEPQDINDVVANAVKNVFKSNLPESKELRLLLVFDEVHRLLPKFGGTGQGFLQIERATREFRKWGVGLMLISQVLTDFVGEIKANINTEVQMRTRDETDMKRIQDSYGPMALKSVVKAAIGTGMVENSNYNHGKPFFVSFRPLMHNHAALPDEELENYNKYNLIIDEIEFQLEQLKAEGVDTFDIALELKLAKDKLKLGNFNMVDIYVESLKPRLEGEWKKLGKQPKHYEVQITEEPEEEAPAKQAKTAEPDQLKAAKELITGINRYLGESKANEAKEGYAQLSQLYKSMSKEQKAAIYKDIASIQGKMPK